LKIKKVNCAYSYCMTLC